MQWNEDTEMEEITSDRRGTWDITARSEAGEREVRCGVFGLAR